MRSFEYLDLIPCRKYSGAGHKDQAARCPQSSVFAGEMSMLRIEFPAPSQTPDRTASFGVTTGGHLSQRSHYIKPDNRIVRQDAKLLMNSLSNAQQAHNAKCKLSFLFDNLPDMEAGVSSELARGGAHCGDHGGNAEISPSIQGQQNSHQRHPRVPGLFVR